MPESRADARGRKLMKPLDCVSGQFAFGILTEHVNKNQCVDRWRLEFADVRLNAICGATLKQNQFGWFG